MDTLGTIRNEVVGWLRGDFDSPSDVPILNAAINDAIEAIWMSMIRAKLNRFVGNDSPVTFQLPANTERVNLIAITDPVAGPVLGQVAIAGIAGPRTLNAAYTYVTESGSETLPSPTVQLVVNNGNLLTAQLPNVAPVAQAIGWNLYTSTNPNAVLALQNDTPLAFAQVFQEDPQGVIDYPDAQQQVPVTNRTADNVSWIRHLEIRTSDTLLRSWNQADIDSMLFRQFARTLSSASEYQAYVWDLINGKQLEFRPMTGSAFTPRYFYIAKPRRLRYDQAEIPYTDITGVHEYVVAKAMQKMKLAGDEYLAMQGWQGLAGEAEMKVLGALTTEDWSRDVRIAPHLY